MGKGGVRDVAKAEFWRGELERWRQSGLSARAFCRKEGVGLNSLRYWKAKIENGTNTVRGLVKVAARVAPAGRLEVVVSGRYRIRVPEGFDGEELVRLIQTLELRG